MRWVTTSSKSKSILSYYRASVDAIAESIGMVSIKIMHTSLYAETAEQKHRVGQKEKQS